MPGPTPKDPAIRQRRNRSTTHSTLVRANEPRKRAPALPDLEDGSEWHKLTRAWWHDIWHSPMAERFLRADEHALLRLALLIDKFWKKPSQSLAAEIRLQQQAFGLTPLDRRRLEWLVEEAEEASPDRAEARQEIKKRVEKQKDQEDPRGVLFPDLAEVDVGKEIPMVD
jgi:hypothetical protein